MESQSLSTLAHEHLDKARGAGSGRSAVTLHGGREHALRQTLLALTEGHALGEHESPGEATLQVVHGRVRLTTADDAWEGRAGDYLLIPPARHDLTAAEDSVVLLTVAVHGVPGT
ncbi:cupin domain-containing protein [Nocardioides sp.]|uniref:cupin domain-containing protein n=1 Tax=Nocardioides sp. TaxID=35761 RepID=UPI0027326715|nr:cupin domain-containing protein [Nocardioides sp.]MDP3892298.1 cupin domain-containing protein [Nocardioides sp.]